MYTRMNPALAAVAGAAALTLFIGNALAQEVGAGNSGTVSLLASNSGAFATESAGTAVPGPEPRQAHAAVHAQAPSATDDSTPEPWTYGLMLAGLGAIGWLKRHRRSS
jgi:hypothetical protein